VTVLACGLPRSMDLPTYVTSTKTTITLKWSPPTDDGGCGIEDYAVYRDPDGTGTAVASSWTLVNPLVRNDPSLLEFTCSTFPVAAAPGNHFVFKITATNQQGSVDSLLSAPMILAGVPAAPSAAPSSDAAVTDHR
jgi:hypothetical protein